MQFPAIIHRRPRARTLLFGAFVVHGAQALAAGPYAYVPSNYDNTISVVDLWDTSAAPSLYTVTGTPSTTAFESVALHPASGMLYVSDRANETVWQVNAATGATVHDYFVGSNPRGIAVTPAGKYVFVANFASSGVSVIDTTTQTVGDVDFSSVSGLAWPSPVGVALDLSGARAYVTDTSIGHRLCRFDAKAPPARVVNADCVVVGEDDNDSAMPVALAVSPDGRRVYVVNRGEGSISVVDTRAWSVTRTFPLGYSTPNGIAVSSSGKRAYVGTAFGFIVVVDLAKVADASQDPVIDVIEEDAISAVQGVSLSPDGTRLLAVDNGASKVHFIDIVDDAHTLMASVGVNEGPIAMGAFTQQDPIFVGTFD